MDQRIRLSKSVWNSFLITLGFVIGCGSDGNPIQQPPVALACCAEFDTANPPLIKHYCSFPVTLYQSPPNSCSKRELIPSIQQCITYANTEAKPINEGSCS